MESKQQIRNDSTIRLLAVAVLQKSHGYERIIKGFERYYQRGMSRKIEFHIVGDGKELAKYKRLVRQYHLENYVLFHGRKEGRELDRIYDHADLALGAFGLYKRGIYKSSLLKIREYLSKGLPIVSGCRDDAIVQGYKYYLEVPNNSMIIDLKELVDFYEAVYEAGMSRRQVHEEIRKYACENIDISITMMPVVAYIAGGL